MNQVKHIAIIGAGISGLACASALNDAGYRVTVFEKSKGVSGRLSTRVTKHWQCDHGAQYFTADDSRFALEVKRWQQAGVADLWQPRLQVSDGLNFSEKPSTKNRYIGVPGNNSPAKFLAQRLNIQANTTINKIERHANKWQLISTEQGINSQLFDALILAIPAPQAQVLLIERAPAFATLASSVKMRGCWTLMCQYNNQLKLPFDGLFINNNLLSWIARDSLKKGRTCGTNTNHINQTETWVLHAESEWSEAHIEDAPDDVASLMLDAFVHLGGEVPAAFTAHRWRYADCLDYLDIGYAWDNDLQLGLCGDWLNGGKVQGAWLSGHLLAHKII